MKERKDEKELVTWNGKERVREQGQIKFWNRVKWFLDDGFTAPQIAHFLVLEQITARDTLLRGEGRPERSIAARGRKRRGQIRRAMRAHGLDPSLVETPKGETE